MLPAGEYSVDYRRDQALVRTAGQKLCLLLFFVALIALPLLFGDRVTAAANVMLIFVVMVVGLQLTTGHAGQINIGQAAFAGVGAYAAAVAAGLGLSFLLAIPIGGIAAALFGLLFGLSAVRIKGFYLALTTIAAQIVFHFSVLNLPIDWFGGPRGLTVPPASLFGFRFVSESALYYLCLAVAVVMVAGALGIARSRFGRQFVAVRDDDTAAAMMGINVVATKSRAFIVGTFYAGIGGALYAYYIRYVAVDQFTMLMSVWMIAMIIVGGLGSVVGAVVGVVVIRLIIELLTSAGPDIVQIFPQLPDNFVFASLNVILGVIIAAFLIFEPKGLMYRWNIIKRVYRIWPYPY